MLVTEKIIENIIREKIEGYINAEKFFNFSRIPIKELEEQYYYLGDALSIKGYGGMFMLGDNDKLLFEEAQATLSPEKTKEQMMKRFNFKDWQVKITIEANNIKLVTLFPDFRENCQLVKDAMTACGWSLALQQNTTAKNGDKWILMSFDPMYQDNISNEIRKNWYLYHWTPLYNCKSILKNGLEVRSENSKYDYSPRIHLLKHDLNDSQIMFIGEQLCNQNKDPRNDGKYALLSIVVRKIPRNTEFFYDPRYEGGYYVTSPIPKEAIGVRFGHDFKNKQDFLIRL